ncbi:amidase [Nonomuraea lactucae]|uniref:amidase n=1 Tax=Nonomuraea lactucae TaxID=2249762 RepID=UPI0013B3CEE5|nr:amidase [Nonomuraea lactucae]
MNRPGTPSLLDTRELLVSGRRSASEIVERALAAIDEREPTSEAFVEVFHDEARRVARRLDDLRRRGARPGPLHGVPIAVKDVFPIAGRHCRAGASFFGAEPRETDTLAVARLRAAGAVIVGRTVTHQFGFGLDRPPTRNAVDAGRQPGGSSAGSAVAVANGSVPGALGADSGGSIRIPAAFNGVVGFKPSLDVVDISDCVPMSPRFDTAGPIAATVADCERLFEVLRGTAESASVPGTPSTFRPRLGIDGAFFATGDPAVREVVRRRLEELESSGRVTLVEAGVPDIAAVPSVLVTILVADSARWHRPLIAGHAADYDPNVLAVIEEGLSTSPGTYQAAVDLQERISNAVGGVMDEHALDGLVCWTAPTGAPVVQPDDTPPKRAGLSELVSAHSRGAFTMLANLTGGPAITIPCGHDGEGMPIGMSILGRPGDDHSLLTIARALEAPHPHLGEPNRDHSR